MNVATSGADANQRVAADVAVSASGRFVVFVSAASNLVAGDTNGSSDVFMRDRLLGTTTRLSVSAKGVQLPLRSNA